MLPRILLSALVVIAACASDTPDAEELELTTNATAYERIPGVPAPPLTLTLHNNSGSAVTIVVCNQDGAPTAPLQYQQRQQDNTWTNIPFGTINCDVPGTPVPVAAGATWIVPPELQAFPTESGTYRIVLTAEASDVLTIVSNSFMVDADFEGTP